MQVWILKPQSNIEKGDNPWEPWYDKAFGFVVIAKNEKDARKIAHKEAGDENRGSFLNCATSKTKTPWLDPKYSTCEPLTAEGKPRVIMCDFASA